MLMRGKPRAYYDAGVTNRSRRLPPLAAMVLAVVSAVVQVAANAITAQIPAPSRASSSTSLSITVSARAVQPGELVLLKITTSTNAHSARVTGMGREFPAFSESPTEWRALVGVDLEVKPGRYDLSVVAGEAATDQTTYRLVVAPKKFATRELTVGDWKVLPFVKSP